MSSEIFSTVRIRPARRVDITQRTRAQIASAKNALRQMSRTMNETARLMQIQGRALSEQLRAQGETESTTVSQSGIGGTTEDVSGFDRSSIDSLVEALRQTRELLETTGETADTLSGEKTESEAIEAVQAESHGGVDASGYVKEDIFELPEGEVMSSDERKILEYSKLLKLTKSKKDAVFAELLIAMFAMFDAPVWSDSDLELKERTRRKVERLDGDETFTIDEKIEKLKRIIAEYSDALSTIPEDFNAEDIIEEYKFLRRKTGRVDTEEIAISRMATEIEAMTDEIIRAEEEEYIRKSVIEAFEREGILLDEYVSAKGKQVFYLEDEENCEVVLEDIDGGFLLESVGLSENGKKASKEEKDEMVTSAKKVCDKYKKVIKHLEEMGIMVNIDAEDEPDSRYIKIAQADSETQDRRHKKKATRRRVSEGKNKRTFD